MEIVGFNFHTTALAVIQWAKQLETWYSCTYA